MSFCVSHTRQSALESGNEARIVQIDLNADCDGVNHQGFTINSAQSIDHSTL